MLRSLGFYYPTCKVDDFRLLLRHCTLDCGAYNIYEIETLLARFKDHTIDIPSVYSSFNVIAH